MSTGSRTTLWNIRSHLSRLVEKHCGENIQRWQTLHIRNRYTLRTLLDDFFVEPRGIVGKEQMLLSTAIDRPGHVVLRVSPCAGRVCLKWLAVRATEQCLQRLRKAVDPEEAGAAFYTTAGALLAAAPGKTALASLVAATPNTSQTASTYLQLSLETVCCSQHSLVCIDKLDSVNKKDWKPLTDRLRGLAKEPGIKLVMVKRPQEGGDMRLSLPKLQEVHIQPYGPSEQEHFENKLKECYLQISDKIRSVLKIPAS